LSAIPLTRRQQLLSLGAGIGSLAFGGTAQGQAVAPPVTRTGPSGLQWVTPRVGGPGLSFHTVLSEAAGTEISFHIYAPRAYAAEPARRFPVVYWLHGSGGGVAGVARLAAFVDEAIAQGRTPPCLVVFVNGLRMGMYVDWSNGQAPLETIIIRELLPHIDAHWRTIGARDGRLLDGFSMGGYGAARFGFRYPELFASVSMMGAGPLQETLDRTPRTSGRRAELVLRSVYGGDQERFRALSPRRYAEQNAAVLSRGSRIRMVIGARDETLQNNADFHAHLVRLGIPHDWIVLPGVGHDPMGVLTALGDRHWAFYREAFRGAGAASSGP
jgi:enterochelin esterase-like enzyme